MRELSLLENKETSGTIPFIGAELEGFPFYSTPIGCYFFYNSQRIYYDS